MEILISVLESRNLSQSTLIARSLRTSLEIGGSTRKATQVEAKDVQFSSVDPGATLVIRVTNCQTQTTMYARTVPLKQVAGDSGGISLWLAVYSPGDPRDLSFDASDVPRHDAPQINLRVVSIAAPDGGTGGGCGGSRPSVSDGGDFERLAHEARRLEAELADVRRQRDEAPGAAAAMVPSLSLPSPRPPDEQLPLSARRAEDIKSKVVELASSVKKARGTEMQLQEVLREVDAMRLTIQQLEAELCELSVTRGVAERAKAEAQERCAELKEALRVRDVSVNEVRGTRDANARRLDDELAERARARAGLGDTSRSQELDLQHLSAELERNRAEAEALGDAIARCDRQVGNLRDQRLDADSSPSRCGAEQRMLQEQLEQAVAELEGLRRGTSAQEANVAEAERACGAARARLEAAEARAREARARSIHEQEAARADAEHLQRELLAQAAKIAQLEGQLGENKIQLKDLHEHEGELVQMVQAKVSAHGSLEATVSDLRVHVHSQQDELECTMQAGSRLDESFRHLQGELGACRRKKTDLEKSCREVELARCRRRDELESTTRDLESQLRSIHGHSSELGVRREEWERETARAEAEVEARVYAYEATSARMAQAEKELGNAREAFNACQGNRAEAQKRLEALNLEEGQASAELRQFEDEFAAMQAERDASRREMQSRQHELEEECQSLQAMLEQNKSEAEVLEAQSEAVARQLAEHRELMPRRVEEAQELQEGTSEMQARLASMQQVLRTARAELAEQVTRVAELAVVRERQAGELARTGDRYADTEHRTSEQRQAIERSRSEAQESLEATRRCVREAVAQVGEAEEEARRLREEGAALAKARVEVSRAREAARTGLERVRGELGQLDAEHGRRLAEAEAALADARRRDEELGAASAALEARLSAIEAETAEAFEQRAPLEAGLGEARRRRLDASTSLARISEDCDVESAARAAGEARLASLYARLEGAERAVAEHRDRLASVAGGARQAAQLQSECEALEVTRSKARAERSRPPPLADDLSEDGAPPPSPMNADIEARNAELDRRIDRIDDLEREVMALESRVEEFSGEWQAPFLARLAAVDAEEHTAKAEEAFHTRHLGTLREELERLWEERAEREGALTASESRMTTLRADVREKEQRVGDLMTRLSEVMASGAEAAATRLQRLQSAQQAVKEQDQRRIEVKGEIEQLRSESAAEEGKLEQARRDLREQAARVGELWRESQNAAEAKPAPPLQEETPEAMDRRIGLLHAQLESRREALRRMEEESHAVCVELEDLAAEREQAADRAADMADKFSHQTDHTSIQQAGIETLELDIGTLESEAEMLAVGLHDAEQRGEALEQMSSLMKRQLEGFYEGSISDLVAEMNRVKQATEIQRTTDELGHWRRVAAEVERELQRDAAGILAQHEAVEGELRSKLEILLDQRQALSAGGGEADCRATPSGRGKPATTGKVHSVAAALHGFVKIQKPLPTRVAAQRRAVIIGCNYPWSHAPLSGCVNDAWNMLSLLRHTLQYREEQVLCLLDGTATCPTPRGKQPTRDKILESLRWLAGSAVPGDNLLFYFSGYGAQQPLPASRRGGGRAGSAEDLCEAHLVPTDFAQDVVGGMGQLFKATGATGEAAPNGSAYRLVPMLALQQVLAGLPAGCKMTVVLDCDHTAGCFESGIGGDGVFPPLALDPVDVPAVGLEGPVIRARRIELPPLPVAPSSVPAVPAGPPAGRCYTYSACGSQQWCAELSIEGCVQGAFTWSFVKALTACHLEASVRQHTQALQRILGDLRQHFRCVEQVPVVCLSPHGRHQDLVLVPDDCDTPTASTGVASAGGSLAASAA